MNILPGPIIETKLKIPGKQQVLPDIVAMRKNAVPATVRKFKADNPVLPVFSVLPSRMDFWSENPFEQDRVIIDFRRGQFCFRDAADGLGKGILRLGFWRKRWGFGGFRLG